MEMHGFDFAEAPGSWSGDDASVSTMHQLSPYIGKLKPVIARDLIEQHSRPGDVVADPFCGSGSIPLEALMGNRRVFASDANPYACLLTRAKLNPPRSLEAALSAFEKAYAASSQGRSQSLSNVPDWVSRFFHPATLREAIAFADYCIESREYFLLACLLGILHHQRPGFLSYPSSHLVPYLRDKKYPQAENPAMYEYRDLAPRMRAKIGRSYKRYEAPSLRESNSVTVRKARVSNVTMPASLDAIITSPPYMNALDYRRDNRLRLWFLDRSVTDYFPEPTDRKEGLQDIVDSLISHAKVSLKSGGRLVLVIGETVVRKRIKSHPSLLYSEALRASSCFKLLDAVRDQIPDVRRSRRDYEGTKAEHILVYQRT